MRRTTLQAVLLGSLTAFGMVGAAAAEEATPTPQPTATAAVSADPRVSMMVRETRLETAIAMLAAQTDFSVRLRNGATNQRVTLSLEDVPLSEAVNALAAQAGLTAWREADGGWSIGTPDDQAGKGPLADLPADRQPPRPDPNSTRVELVASDSKLATIAPMLESMTNRRVELIGRANSERVTVLADGVAVEEVLDRIATGTRLVWWRTPEGYAIGAPEDYRAMVTGIPAPTPAASLPPIAPAPRQSLGSEESRRERMRQHEQRVRDILEWRRNNPDKARPTFAPKPTPQP